MGTGLAILSGLLGFTEEEDTTEGDLEGPLVPLAPLAPLLGTGAMSVELAEDTGLARLAYIFSESALDTDDLLLIELLLEREREGDPE